MTELRAAKLVSATLLICAGAICIAIGDLVRYGGAGVAIGFVLLAFGVPMLVRQWTGYGIGTHLTAAVRWLLFTPWLAGEKSTTEEPIKAGGRS